MSVDHRSQAAVSLLSRMLFGVSETAQLERQSAEEPDYALDQIEADGTAVSTKLYLPSGDVYRVSVAWDAEESP